MLTFVVVWNIAVITLKKYMSAYRRVHVNMYFLNQEKGHVVVYYCRTYYKILQNCACGGEEDSGGHMLQDTMSLSPCVH
jgi:hypothetical protein